MGSFGPRGGVGIFFLAPPRWGGTLGVTFSWSRCGARFGPLSGSISWSLRGLELGFLGPHFVVLHGPNFFLFCLVLSRTRSSWSFGARLSWSLGASFSWSFRGLDFLVHRGLVFLLLAGARFPSGPLRARFFLVHSGARFFLVLSRARFSWSSRGLDSFGPFEGSIPFGPFEGSILFGPLEGSIFWSCRGLDFLVLSVEGSIFVVLSRARFFFGPLEGSIFFWSFRGLDFSWPFGGPIFRDSLSGIHCLYYRHRPMVRALGGLVSLGLSVLSPFRISGLSILICAQAHCSCFFRHRCG